MNFPDDLMHLVRTDEPLGAVGLAGNWWSGTLLCRTRRRERHRAAGQSCHERQLPSEFLGGGSKFLVREAGVDGLVISLTGGTTSQMSIDGIA